MSIFTYLSLGGNLGNTIEIFQNSYEILAKKAGKITKLSSFYQTEAWGPIPQNDFINQVVELNTALSPNELMVVLLEIELQMGRIRNERWGPRSLDLDILLYGDVVISNELVEIPHPRMAERNFVLIPLAEINPTLIHPIHQKSIQQLILECKDDAGCMMYEVRGKR